MTETKHTPGPWEIIIDDDGNPLSGRPMIAAAPELDCAIVHWDGFVQPYWRSARGDKEIHANACLIAAAPDLLEALERIEGMGHSEPMTWAGSELDWAKRRAGIMQNIARAAIAKAKGESK
jgi:hypothetical protein